MSVRVLGVDGCKSGWIAAEVAASTVGWLRLPNARSIADVATDYDAVGIDIPIGLPESSARTCDLLARRLLRERGVCVFPAPMRCELSAETYDEACALSRAAHGKALSWQTWHITARIKNVDEWLASLSNVVEVHPEVSFATLTGAPLPPKRTAEGRVARLHALRSWLPDFELPTSAHIDALDALAVAWSAQRWALGKAMTMPEAVPVDSRGRPMRIVA